MGAVVRALLFLFVLVLGIRSFNSSLSLFTLFAISVIQIKWLLAAWYLTVVSVEVVFTVGVCARLWEAMIAQENLLPKLKSDQPFWIPSILRRLMLWVLLLLPAFEFALAPPATHLGLSSFSMVLKTLTLAFILFFINVALDALSVHPLKQENVSLRVVLPVALFSSSAFFQSLLPSLEASQESWDEAVSLGIFLLVTGLALMVLLALFTPSQQANKTGNPLAGHMLIYLLPILITTVLLPIVSFFRLPSAFEYAGLIAAEERTAVEAFIENGTLLCVNILRLTFFLIVFSTDSWKLSNFQTPHISLFLNDLKFGWRVWKLPYVRKSLCYNISAMLLVFAVAVAVLAALSAAPTLPKSKVQYEWLEGDQTLTPSPEYSSSGVEPSCSLTFHEHDSSKPLQIVDMAILAELAYGNPQNMSNQMLLHLQQTRGLLYKQTHFEDTSVWHYQLCGDVCTKNGTNEAIIIAIRGTHNMRDLLTDARIFASSFLSHVVLESLPVPLPWHYIFPDEYISFLQLFLANTVMTGQEFGLGESVVLDSDLHVPRTVPLYTLIQSQLKFNPKSKVFIVGHSLGGALAQALACFEDLRNNDRVIPIAFNSPGLAWSQRLFDISHECLLEKGININLATDPVSKIDLGRGTVHTLPCPYINPFECHSMSHLLCILWSKCDPNIPAFCQPTVNNVKAWRQGYQRCASTMKPPKDGSPCSPVTPYNYKQIMDARADHNRFYNAFYSPFVPIYVVFVIVSVFLQS